MQHGITQTPRPMKETGMNWSNNENSLMINLTLNGKKSNNIWFYIYIF